MRHDTVMVAATLLIAASSFGQPPRAEPDRLFEPLETDVSLALLQSQPPSMPAPPDTGDALWAEVTLLAWTVIDCSGDVDQVGSSTDVDADFGDYRGAGEAAIEIGKGKWSGILSGTYVGIDSDATTTLTGLGTFGSDFEMQLGVIDAAVTYSILDWTMGDDARPWGIDLLGGARTMLIDTDIDVGALPTIGPDDVWVDLIIGARLHAELADGWSLVLRGDVGGFGISGSSDTMWSVTAGGTLALSSTIDLQLGYKILDFEWIDGSTEYDLTMHGPAFGLTIRF